MRVKALITCGQKSCDYNFDGYCQRKNIHISSKDKTCDVYNPKEAPITAKEVKPRG